MRVGHQWHRIIVVVAIDVDDFGVKALLLEVCTSIQSTTGIVRASPAVRGFEPWQLWALLWAGAR